LDGQKKLFIPKLNLNAKVTQVNKSIVSPIPHAEAGLSEIDDDS